MCPNGRIAEMNLADTMAREEIIRQHMDLKTVWECDVQAQLKTRTKDTEKMREFFVDCPSYGPIDPRDAYFGGRTGPMRLCFETEGRDDLEISYLDIQVRPFLILFDTRKLLVALPVYELRNGVSSRQAGRHRTVTRRALDTLAGQPLQGSSQGKKAQSIKL